MFGLVLAAARLRRALFRVTHGLQRWRSRASSWPALRSSRALIFGVRRPESPSPRSIWQTPDRPRFTSEPNSTYTLTTRPGSGTPMRAPWIHRASRNFQLGRSRVHWLVWPARLRARSTASLARQEPSYSLTRAVARSASERTPRRRALEKATPKSTQNAARPWR